MINVAIVEDDDAAAESLAGFIARAGQDTGEGFCVTRFRNALDLISDYKAQFDILFMDIELPGMDGMTACRKLRETDGVTVVVFVTNMAQYAVRGYEVNALDYIVKPVAYYDFLLKLKRAVAFVRAHDDGVLSVAKAGGYVRLYIRDIAYVEVMGHKLCYHTSDGGVTEAYDTLSGAERRLEGYDFIRCNNYCLVNPAHITYVHGYELRVGDRTMEISHPKKKKFTEAFNKWLAGGRA